MKLNTYLTFDGKCAEAFKHYERCLGGKLEVLQTHGETPMADQLPPEWKDRIMHAHLVVGESALMGSDSPPEHYEKAAGFSVAIHADSVEEAERAFAALSEGGEVRMPLAETFWATRFGMLTDKFGVRWMVNFQRPES